MSTLKPFFSYLITCCGLLPSLCCLFYFFYARENLQQLQQKLTLIHKRTALVDQAQAQEGARLQKLQAADPTYLEKTLAGLTFLQAEIKRLQVLSNERNAKRLRFFKEGSNSLHFIEENFREKPPFQESDVRLEHPVEMDTEDLKQLLKCIEEIEAPELVIKQFELSRKSSSPQEEVYLINFTLIKRELLHAKNY